MPEKEGGGPSMFETVKNHEERISNLEEADKKHEERLTKLEEHSIKIENTIMTENRETRSTMKEQTEKLFDLVKNAMGFQSSKYNQDHEFRMAKINTFATVFLKITSGLGVLFSGGGLAYYLITKFF